MRKYVIAFLLGAPCIVKADLIVDYTGRITTVDTKCWCRTLTFKKGDPVFGHLLIDTDTAPADSDPDPLSGLYDGSTGPNPNFVIGTHSLIPGSDLTGPDIFAFGDQHPGDDYEGLTLVDARGTRASGDFTELQVNFGHSFNLDKDFIRGDGLNQSFVAVRDSESGVAIGGFLRRAKGSFSYVVNFVVDRLSIRPQICRSGS